MSDSSQGTSVEDYARRLAGGMGVPDFVYEPVLVQRGGGSREISDGLLVAGSDGLIVQVKSRERPGGEADSEDRAKAWCLKQGGAAQRQGRGPGAACSGRRCGYGRFEASSESCRTDQTGRSL